MIKIEFKEAQDSIIELGGIIFVIMIKQIFFDKPNNKTRNLPGFGCPDIGNVTLGSVSELVPSREEVLQQLGISKEQDEQMQLKYK